MTRICLLLALLALSACAATTVHLRLEVPLFGSFEATIRRDETPIEAPGDLPKPTSKAF